jgi:hypothetical protein
MAHRGAGVNMLAFYNNHASAAPACPGLPAFLVPLFSKTRKKRPFLRKRPLTKNFYLFE